ncbi:MAG: DUF429 domain-containing protein [Verrucomicrobiota bacterium JB022]|nr:DUF429 domain-containing protein [Verrucomicrobiota bacterium JB022]
MSAEPNQVVGVDGCRSGWIAVAGGAEPTTMRVFGSVQELWEAYSDASTIAIDMPIGMASGRQRRACDRAAHVALRLRRGAPSRVFPVPVREVLALTVDAPYAEVLKLHRQVGGRGLSQQAYHILPKIRELDALLQAVPDARERIVEAHPEIAAARLNGGVPLPPKKESAGFERRLQVLEAVIPRARELYATWRPLIRGAAQPDDLIDALLCWRVARRPRQERGTLPWGPTPHDATGLPMRIVF